MAAMTGSATARYARLSRRRYNRQRFATAAGSAWLDGNEQASQKSGRVLFGEDPRAQHVLSRQRRGSLCFLQARLEVW